MDHDYQHLPPDSDVPTDPDYPTLQCSRCGKWWLTFGPPAPGPDNCGRIKYRTVHEVQFLEAGKWKTHRVYLKLAMARQYMEEMSADSTRVDWQVHTYQIPINYQVATIDHVLAYHGTWEDACRHAERLVHHDRVIKARRQVVRVSERLTTTTYHTVLTYHPAPEPLVQGYGVHCTDHRERFHHAGRREAIA